LNAVQIHAHGGIDELRYEQAADPELEAPTDVIVKLKTAAVNRLDIEIRSGQRAGSVFFPRIVGSDGAGTVLATGSAVGNVQVGDKVCLFPIVDCGRCDFCATDRAQMCADRRLLSERENGTYAEYVRVSQRNCFPIPAELSFEAAAAFPLVYGTSWRMLISQAELRPGEWLLIVGVGGIATAALRIAASLGARVILASGSDEKLARAAELGAEHAINYRNTNFITEVRNRTGKRGVDVVVDCVAGDGWVKSLATLARGGRLVTCGAIGGAHPQTDLRRIFWNNLKIFGAGPPTRAEFYQLLSFFDASRAAPIIDRVYPLQEAAEAQKRMEKGKARGKIVLQIGD
jgi:NADPH:quinone reductase-like Zn-dependent oxidoreductase